MNTKTYLEHKKFSRAFTTEPKTLKAVKRLFWHRQTTVRNRAYALQESFFPTTDVLYAAVVQRMANLLGIMDRASILAYLGRPKHEKSDRLDQTVQYPRSGAIVQKVHTFKHKLPAKKGYIESLGLGYVYLDPNREWWVHWDHEAQTKLTSYQGEGEAAISSQGECVGVKVSKGDFSHIKIATPTSTAADVISEEKKKEGYSLCERNCGSESILCTRTYRRIPPTDEPFNPNLYGAKPRRESGG